MRINKLNPENNSSKIKELTIYRVLTNPKTNNDINNELNNDNIINNNLINYNSSNTKKIKFEQNSTNFQNMSPITIPNKTTEPPELWDDEYILELHKKLEEKRELRKISEQNVKILNGRVRCLKDENKKICAKIDIAKKKTKEKEKAINNHKSRSKEKVELKEKRQNDLKKLKLKNKPQKLITQENLINTRENMILKNKIKGQISKAQKVDNENLIKENELSTNNSIKKTGDDKNIIEIILDEKYKKILIVENKGRDILPFLTQFKSKYKLYKYLCHIHSKKSISIWRKYLYNNNLVILI